MYKWWKPSKVPPAQPWIHPSAVSYLEYILRPDMTVCEFGGGGSTVWLADRVKEVYTYENNLDWYLKIKEFKLHNVTLRYSEEWRGDTCNLLFIDGEPIEKRINWISQAPYISNEWIVIDNANRSEFELAKEELKKHAELIQSVNGNEENTLYLFTEFWRVK